VQNVKYEHNYFLVKLCPKAAFIFLFPQKEGKYDKSVRFVIVHPKITVNIQ